MAPRTPWSKQIQRGCAAGGSGGGNGSDGSATPSEASPGIAAAAGTITAPAAAPIDTSSAGAGGLPGLAALRRLAEVGGGTERGEPPASANAGQDRFSSMLHHLARAFHLSAGANSPPATPSSPGPVPSLFLDAALPEPEAAPAKQPRQAQDGKGDKPEAGPPDALLGAALRRAPGFGEQRWQLVGEAMAVPVSLQTAHDDMEEPLPAGAQPAGRGGRGGAGSGASNPLPQPLLSPCGQLVAMFGAGRVLLWHREARQVRCELDLARCGAPPCAAVFTHCGSALVICTALGAIVAWDVQKGSLLAVLREAGRRNEHGSTGWPGPTLHTGPGVLAWSGHGRGQLQVWSTASWQAVNFQLGVPKDNLGRIISCQVSANGRKIAALLIDAGDCQGINMRDARKLLDKQHGAGTIKIWDLRDGKELSSVALGRCPEACWFTGQLDRAACWFKDPSAQSGGAGGGAPMARLRSLNSGKFLRRASGSYKRVASRASSPGGAADGGDAAELACAPPFVRCVEVWDLRAGEVEFVHEDISDQPLRCAFTVQGHRLAIHQEQLVSLWDMKQCIQLTVFPGGGPVVFSPDSRLLACSDPLRPVVVIWNVEAGTRLFDLKIHDEDILAQSAYAQKHQEEEEAALHIAHIAFSADSAQLLSAWGPDGSTVLWNIAPGAAYHKVPGRLGPNVQRRGDSPDALLGWTADGTRAMLFRETRYGPKLELWNLQTGVRLSSKEYNNAPPLVSFSIDGSGTCATSCDLTGSLCRWDLLTGESLGTPGGDGLAGQEAAAEEPLEPSNPAGWPALRPGCQKKLPRVEELQLSETAPSRGRDAVRFSVSACAVSEAAGVAAQLLVNRQLLLVRAEDGHCLHSLGAGQLQSELAAHLSCVSALTFAADGLRLLSSGGDGTLVAWDTATGHPAYVVAQVATATWAESAAGRGASMPAAGLAAWQSDMAAAGQPAGEAAGTRRFLHARSARVSPSGGALAVLRFGCVSREARDGAADADGGLLRATSGMSHVSSRPGTPLSHGTLGRTLHRGLPLSFCAQQIEDSHLSLAGVAVLCAASGEERLRVSVDQICEALPLHYAAQFEPTMCCWSGDSSCLALYGCRRGTPAAVVFRLTQGSQMTYKALPLLGEAVWSFSTCCLSADGSRLVATGEDPAIHSLFAVSIMRVQAEQAADAYTLPIQVWSTTDSTLMYSIRQHSGPVIDLALSMDDSVILAAATSGIYALTMAAAEGMHPDPHQVMEMSSKDEMANPYGDYGAPGGGAIHSLLEAYPMLPNQLDAEGRNLITLAAQRNQEALMLAILGSAHAEEYGLKGAGFHLNAMSTALQHSPACVSLLMKALMDNRLRAHSTATCIPEVLRGLLKKFPGEIVAYLGKHGVTDLGSFLISNNVGNLEKGMVTTSSPYFYVQRPQLLWRGLVDEIEETGVPRRRRIRHRGRNKRELEIPAAARVVTIPGCCLPGQRGLLQALLHYPTVPIAVWGLPIVQAVITFKWRKFGRRYVIWEFVFYMLWLLTYTIFLLLLPSVQSHAAALVEEGGPGAAPAALYSSPQAVCASLFLCVSFVITIRNVISEGKQVLAAGVKEWASSPWNIVDMLSLMLWLCLLPMYFTQVAPNHLNPLVAFNSILMWSKLLYFALAFENTSALVRMVLEILRDMKHFLLLLVTVMIGFGCAFFVIFSGYDAGVGEEASFNQFSSPLVTMFTMYSMMLGYFDTAQLFDSPMPVPSIVLFVLYELMVVIILLNLLIAIMGDSFDKVRETEKLQFMRGRASVIDGIETTLSKEQLQNKDWFPEGYIHILERRYDEGDHQNWVGRIKAIERAQETTKREILAAMEHAVTETRAAMRDEMAAKFEELSAQLSMLGAAADARREGGAAAGGEDPASPMGGNLPMRNDDMVSGSPEREDRRTVLARAAAAAMMRRQRGRAAPRPTAGAAQVLQVHHSPFEAMTAWQKAASRSIAGNLMVRLGSGTPGSRPFSPVGPAPGAAGASPRVLLPPWDPGSPQPQSLFSSLSRQAVEQNRQASHDLPPYIIADLQSTDREAAGDVESQAADPAGGVSDATHGEQREDAQAAPASAEAEVADPSDASDPLRSAEAAPFLSSEMAPASDGGQGGDDEPQSSPPAGRG